MLPASHSHVLVVHWAWLVVGRARLGPFGHPHTLAGLFVPSWAPCLHAAPTLLWWGGLVVALWGTRTRRGRLVVALWAPSPVCCSHLLPLPGALCSAGCWPCALLWLLLQLLSRSSGACVALADREFGLSSVFWGLHPLPFTTSCCLPALLCALAGLLTRGVDGVALRWHGCPPPVVGWPLFPACSPPSPTWGLLGGCSGGAGGGGCFWALFPFWLPMTVLLFWVGRCSLFFRRG